MQQILVYSDSLSWGIIPDTRNRLPFDKRWPGVLETSLNATGRNVRVIENCLNGRRTCWEDPYKEGRDGSKGLAQVIEMHSPLSLVILMLGTNDFQCMHNNDAWTSAQGVAKLVGIIRSAPIEPGMPVPGILIVCPPLPVNPRNTMAEKFKDAGEKCLSLPQELAFVAGDLSAHYFDANSVISTSKLDGVHLDTVQHDILGKALADAVIKTSVLL